MKTDVNIIWIIFLKEKISGSNYMKSFENWTYNVILLKLIIYNFFSASLREFYFTKDSQYQFCYQNIQSAASDVLLAKLVEGTRG